MNMRTIQFFYLMLCTAVVLFLTHPVHAAGIKERMAARIPTIIKLKNSGVIGENNNGYLAFVGAKKAETALVSAENNDRKSVYGAIAKQQGVSPALVGQRRAQMILKNGAKGHWFQNSGGKWFKK